MLSQSTQPMVMYRDAGNLSPESISSWQDYCSTPPSIQSSWSYSSYPSPNSVFYPDDEAMMVNELARELSSITEGSLHLNQSQPSSLGSSPSSSSHSYDSFLFYDFDSSNEIKEEQKPVSINQNVTSIEQDLNLVDQWFKEVLYRDEKNNASSGKTRGTKNCLHVWEFKRDLLMSGQHQDIIEWLDEKRGLYKLLDPVMVAFLWYSNKKRNLSLSEMSEEEKKKMVAHMNRGVRYSRDASCKDRPDSGFFDKVTTRDGFGKKNVYKFGRLARESCPYLSFLML